MLDGTDQFGTRSRVQIDWWLFLSVVAVAVIGVVNLYSATSYYVGAERRAGLADIYVSQVYWVAVGAMLGIFAAAIDYRHFERFAYFSYVGGLITLCLVFVLGAGIRGAVRWIQIGSFSFQPSEFMKLLVVLVLAKYLHDDPKTEPRTLFDLVPPLVLTAVPVTLVMIQPDFGTSMVYVLTAFTMLAMTKIRRRSVFAVMVATPPLAWVTWSYVLRDYQKQRVNSFLDPSADITGAGWHAAQSQTAIGNGGLWGEGFMQGTQNQFGFLPDQHSDFPFSVFAEDWGFVGSVVLLGLYCFVCIWAVHVASQARDRFGAALAVGVGSLFFFHTIFNVGMVVGLLPVVGITLPLFSYGGSSVITTLVGFGLLMNVSMRR